MFEPTDTHGLEKKLGLKKSGAAEMNMLLVNLRMLEQTSGGSSKRKLLVEDYSNWGCVLFVFFFCVCVCPQRGTPNPPVSQLKQMDRP